MAANDINLISTQGNTNIGANINYLNSETETREGTLKLSIGLNHVAIDLGYAVADLAKAVEAVTDAKNNLNHMKNLRDQGKAEDEAVRDAEINVSLSLLNVELATLKVQAASDKIDKASETWGFYVDLQMSRTGQKTNSITNSNEEIASNLVANKDIYIFSGRDLPNSDDQSVGNTNIKGHIVSNEGDIKITSRNDTNI
jgi:hypothetical protein